MSFLIDKYESPGFHWMVETSEFALSASCLSAGLGYLLHATKVIQLTHPLQGGIYGAVAAVVLSIAAKLLADDKDRLPPNEDPLTYFAVAASVVVATGVTYAAGFPMTYMAGACLFPAVFVAKRVADVFREALKDRYESNCC